jgi:hypothetical protein
MQRPDNNPLAATIPCVRLHAWAEGAVCHCGVKRCDANLLSSSRNGITATVRCRCGAAAGTAYCLKHQYLVRGKTMQAPACHSSSL